MADLVVNTTVALTKQTVADSFVAPVVATNGLACGNLRINLETYSIADPTYNGSIHAPGNTVTGKGFTASFSAPIIGPGGAAPPAANAFTLGLLFQAMGFTESIISTAIPAAPEAIGGGTTTTVTLGATAAATADLYKGLLVYLSVAGASTSLKAHSMIRAYSAAKLATLAETFGAAITGTYQIPRQLAYLLSPSSTLPLLSGRFWRGNKRYDVMNLGVSAFRVNLPVSNRDQTAIPTLEVTVAGDLITDADEAAPILAPHLAFPFFRDGDQWVSGKALGGASFSYEMSPTLGYPPNGNKSGGNDPAQVTRTQRSVAIELNQVAKTVFDPVALADAQAYHAIWAQYGLTPGNMFSALAADARLTYPTDTETGEFIGHQINAFIDGADKAMSFVFPYPA